MSETETVTIERVRNNMPWPPERSAELERLWHRGLSATQIAGSLGDGLTRNAVIGKIHRLGLSEPSFKKQPKPEKKAKAPRASRDRKRQGDHHAIYKIANGGNGGTRVIQSTMSAEIAELRSVDIVPRLVTFAELQAGDCKYIYGVGHPSEYRFCGHPRFTYGRAGVDVKSPYCGGHHDLTSGPGTGSERAATKGIAA